MPSDLRIRPAEPGDDSALAALDRRTADPGTFVMRPEPDAAFFGRGTEPSEVLVAETEGRVVGYVKLRAPTTLASNAHVLAVQGLAVDPSVRRRGIARRLLHEAEQEARRRGARKISLRVLSSNAAARRLYASQGWEVEGALRAEFRLEDGSYVDDYMLAKSLLPAPGSDGESATG